jgi:hypothetical protein
MVQKLRDLDNTLMKTCPDIDHLDHVAHMRKVRGLFLWLNEYIKVEILQTISTLQQGMEEKAQDGQAIENRQIRSLNSQKGEINSLENVVLQISAEKEVMGHCSASIKC